MSSASPADNDAATQLPPVRVTDGHTVHRQVQSLQILRPSFHAPALAPDVIERPRVWQRLESSVAANRITMLIGPHGSGKTTAAAQCASHVDFPVVWINAEESGGEPWEFYADLVDELQAAADLPDLETVVGGLSQPRPIRRMGLVLARELHRCRIEAMIIVDRAELLTEEARSLITTLVSGSVRLKFLLLATQLEADFVFGTETQYQGQVLDVDFLAMTPEEISQALASAGLDEVEGSSVAALSSPVMLRSLVVRCRRRPEQPVTPELIGELQRELAVQSMHRVLAEGILGEDPVPVLLFSLAQMVDAELAARLLDISTDKARRVLNDMRCAGIGSTDEEGVLRMDSALIEGLRELAAEQLSDAERIRAHTIIAAWYRSRGHPWEAMQHADRAGEWQQIAEILLVHYDRIPRGAHGVLLDILQRVPTDVMHLYPYVGWFRMMLLHDLPHTTLTMLRVAGDEVLAALDEDAQDVHAHINRAVRFAYHYVMGEYEAADEEVSGLLPVVESLLAMGAGAIAELPADQYYILEAARTWVAKALRQYAATTKLFLGDHQAALSLIEPNIQPIVDPDGKPSWRNLYSAGLKALTLATAGNITGARAVMDFMGSFDLPPGWNESYLGAPACIAAAHIALADRRPETARAELERIKCYQGSSDFWVFILDLRARISFYHHEPGMLSYIEAEFHARRERPPASRYMQVHLQTRAAAAAMVAGALPSARKHLARGWELDYLGRPGASLERTEAVFALYLKNWEGARGIAADMLNTRTMMTAREEISLHLCWAHAEAVLAVEESAEASFDVAGREFLAALSLAEDCGTPHDVLLIPAELLERLLARFAPHRRDLTRLRRSDGEPRDPIEAPQLTESERRVLEELVHTDSRPAIAAALHLSENTVKTHLRKIYRKFGVHNRKDALELAYSCGLFTPA